MLDAENGFAELEIVVRAVKIGKREFGFVSYRGQRCKIILGNVDHKAFFEAIYYPSKTQNRARRKWPGKA